MPPVALRVVEGYAVFNVPVGNVAGVTESGGLTTIWNWPDAEGRVSEMDESVTVAVKPKVPAVVGVPVIVPAVLRVKPGGRLPAVTDQ